MTNNFTSGINPVQLPQMSDDVSDDDLTTTESDDSQTQEILKLQQRL